MLQQTTVKAVVPYYSRFLARFPTLADLARARVSEVLAAWSGLGYYRRARSLHAAARLVTARHGGLVPDSRDALLALPGIGRYTAGAILSLAFGQHEPVVDGNVARVLSRLCLEREDPRTGSARERLWDAARALVEASAVPGVLNQALMELGATVCTPAAPACRACPLSAACAARARGLQGAIPAAARRRKPVRQRSRLAIVRRNGRLLMRRRQGTGLMDGLWEFPEVVPARRAPDGAPGIAAGRRLASVTHSITYRRIEVQIHEGRLLGRPRGPAYRWVTPDAARRLPASSLVRKTLDRLEQPSSGRPRGRLAGRPPARPRV
jgi:A/G-specific adenine glycosylase